MKIAQGEKKKQRHLKLLRTLCSCLARKRNDKDSALQIIQIMNMLVPDYLEREYSLCSVVWMSVQQPETATSAHNLEAQSQHNHNQSGNKKKTYRTRCFKCSKHNNNKLAKLRRCASQVKLHGVVHGGRQGGRQGGQHVGWSRVLVNWVQTFSTRSLPDLRVF